MIFIFDKANTQNFYLQLKFTKQSIINSKDIHTTVTFTYLKTGVILKLSKKFVRTRKRNLQDLLWSSL